MPATGVHQSRDAVRDKELCNIFLPLGDLSTAKDDAMGADVVAQFVRHEAADEGWKIQTAFNKSHAITDAYKKASPKNAKVMREAMMTAVSTLQ